MGAGPSIWRLKPWADAPASLACRNAALFHRGSGLRFVGTQEIELRVCPSDLESPRGDGSFTCRAPAQVRRIAVPRRPA